MKRKKLLAAVPLTFLFGLSSCGTNSPKVVIVDKTCLDTPTISVNESGQIECSDVANAESYILEYLNEETNKAKRVDVEAFPYTIEFTESGVYSVRVAALPSSDSIYSQSKFSDYVQLISPIKSKLSAPKNLKVVNNGKITFDKVMHAAKYQIGVGDRVFETKETYFDYSFLPGTSYKIKVKACIDENVFLYDSDWSNEESFKYYVNFSKPTGLAVSGIGALTWSCGTYCAQTGFTVKAVNQSTKEVTTFQAMTLKAHITSLSAGSYDLSVMANGVGDNVGSAYSSPISVKIEDVANWTPSDIASSFTSCNYTTAVNLSSEGVASMRCGLGWGGLYTPAISVNFDKNPILAIDYKEVGFGYMGFYYYDGTSNATFAYQNDCILQEKAYDVELAYDMKKNAIGVAESRATGNVTGLNILIGFTGAPAAYKSDNTINQNREVAKLRSVRVMYITVL